MTAATPLLQPGTALPSCEIRISQPMIDTYAAISGDFNPLHVDPEAAGASEFGGTIAHGCIPMEPVFQAVQRWLGTRQLPEGCVIRLRYRAPSRPGDVIHSDAKVTEVEPAGTRQRVRIGFVCANQHGQTVIDGECELQL